MSESTAIQRCQRCASGPNSSSVEFSVIFRALLPLLCQILPAWRRSGSGMVRLTAALVVALWACLADAAESPSARPGSTAAPAPVPSPSGAGAEESTSETPDLSPPPALGNLEGRIVRAIEVKALGNRWFQPVKLKTVRVGDRLTSALAR